MKDKRRRTVLTTNDIIKMREFRKEGLSNKQIAARMGIGVTTVYDHIGKKSLDVKYSEIQNKPSPIKTEIKYDSKTLMVVHDIDIPKKEVVEEAKVEKVEIDNNLVNEKVEIDNSVANTIDIPVEEKEEDVVVESTNLLQVLSTRMELKGSLCNFTVDSKSGTIEMADGVMSGILDRDTVIRFIAELSEASKYIIKEDHN